MGSTAKPLDPIRCAQCEFSRRGQIDNLLSMSFV